MRKKSLLFVALLIGVTITSFAQTKDVVEYSESSARNLEPVQSVMILPLVAEMKVISDRISYTEVDAYKNYYVTPTIVSNVPNFKKIALSRAAHKYGADALVGAVFDVITNASGHLEITVTGYPAKYVNFRNATKEDIELISTSNHVVENKGEDVISNPQSKTKLTLVK